MIRYDEEYTSYFNTVARVRARHAALERQRFAMKLRILGLAMSGVLEWVSAVYIGVEGYYLGAAACILIGLLLLAWADYLRAERL